jgi:hypothetical protein
MPNAGCLGDDALAVRADLVRLADSRRDPVTGAELQGAAGLRISAAASVQRPVQLSTATEAVFISGSCPERSPSRS